MADALLAGVSGMKAHQKMIDVAGGNLANVNTTAYKGSRVRFSDLLSETLKDASQPTSTVGGSNPQQVGSGVKLSSVDRDMSQGSLLTTGQPLDMAVEGAGYLIGRQSCSRAHASRASHAPRRPARVCAAG